MKCAVTLVLLLLAGTNILSANNHDKNTGTIIGRTVDRETSEPLGFVYLHLEELNKTVTAHADGRFQFQNIPEGEYTLSASRIGYQSVSQVVAVENQDTTEVTISLKSAVLNSQAVEVVGQRSRNRANLADVSKTVSGTELRQDLGTTLASTLSNVTGLSARTMGAAPARPVIRGLGGERVLILQDGERTGDVSSQSADHAVTVDPMAAEKIEIARGPAALQYGSNAIGGVVNVVRNQISPSQPDHIHGTMSLQGESVNTGAVAALEAAAPLGNKLVFKFDGNLRSARNINTPEGKLSNSGILSTNNALGISYIQPWGYAGLASSIYLNNYGIPPDPEGGHENGVDIEMEKFQAEGKTEIQLNNSFFKSLDAGFSYKNYYHQEIEAGGAIGTEFGVLTSNASITTHHEQSGFLDEGSLGFWGETKNYAVNGTQTPDSDSYSFGIFLIEEKNIGPLHVEVGARFDAINSVPEENKPNSSIGNIRERTFTALASSASVTYDLGSSFHTGATFLHSFRAPSQEELYSEGPHLASYSYEVGNPDLKPERGLGKELFIRYKTTNTTAELNVYHNLFVNYIYPRNTGRPSSRFPSLNVYQFTGVKALFQGFETSSQIQIFDHWALNGALSYTYAKRKITDEEQSAEQVDWQPLPMIPPFKGTVGLTYASGGFQIGSKMRFAAEQTKTGDFETPTKGYTVLDLFGQYRFQSGGMLHTLSINAENIFNTSYRNHLSRIKDLIPEPGRNISLLYRVYF